MITAESIKHELMDAAEPERVEILQRFFKTGKGDYAEGDLFRGIRVPNIRSVAKRNQLCDDLHLVDLLYSPWHEDRLCALIILTLQYKKAATHRKYVIYELYLEHRAQINNWDLVDSSAHLIVGDWLMSNDTSVLFELATSEVLWDRRIAVIATFTFIRIRRFEETLILCENLLTDPEDLIHKACGWMLREVGNRDMDVLRAFLNAHSTQMPRTMLRYSIERMSQSERAHWMRRIT
jgi:3-methyladenine DNA glycosylase AlkD